MRKVFWENPYQHSLTTKIADVEGNQFLFEETIAYSFSGGQESDKAYINGFPVLDSKMEGNLIYYTLPEGHGLSKGDTVKMVIDWPRRYRLMRLHFAAELVLEIVTQKFHLEKVGAHISETKSRIDFVFGEHISTLFDVILDEYNEIIKSDRLIQTGFTDVENQRRFWKIEGFAQVPCGGTHVKSTAEVGFVTLKRSRSGKSIERIEIKLVDDSVFLQS
jgi:Ser-tRNA(Ala) deacylase AlaX